MYLFIKYIYKALTCVVAGLMGGVEIKKKFRAEPPIFRSFLGVLAPMFF